MNVLFGRIFGEGHFDSLLCHPSICLGENEFFMIGAITEIGLNFVEFCVFGICTLRLSAQGVDIGEKVGGICVWNERLRFIQILFGRLEVAGRCSHAALRDEGEKISRIYR